MTTLTTLPLAAADYIREHGWTQNTMEDDDGRVCLTGALRYCAPQPGDFYLARGVYRHWERSEKWNDAPGRTREQVLDALARNITDADLKSAYGPNWLGIVRLVRRAAVLTHKEARDFNAARVDATGDDAAAWDAAVAAAPDAVWDAWGAARRAAWIAAWGTAKDAAEDAAWDAWDAAEAAGWDAAASDAAWAASGAACALVVRDLITPEQFNLATRPWVSVIGPTWDEETAV